MNYKILVQYDGTRYEGWQRQERTESTIQGKIEAVLSKMCGEEVQIQGAGRTDAGVHAKEQVANVHLKEGRSTGSETVSEPLSAGRYCRIRSDRSSRAFSQQTECHREDLCLPDRHRRSQKGI